MNGQFCLDGVMRSIEQGGLTLITGGNATGKTAFAIQLAVKAGLEDKKSVLLFSPSLKKGVVLSRMLSSISKIELTKLLNGHLDQDDHKRLVDEAFKLSAASIFMDDNPELTVDNIIHRVSILIQTKNNIDMVIIDSVCCIRSWGKTAVEELKKQLCDKGIALVLLDTQDNKFINADRTLLMRRDGSVVKVSITQDGTIFSDILKLRFVTEYASLA